MELIPFEKMHLAAAGRLLMNAYEKERAIVPALPYAGGADLFADMVSGLAGNGLGIAAIENGVLIGFLTGMAVGELFGLSRGVYTPIYAHGAAGRDKSLVYKLMYAAISDEWVKQGLLSHVITMYTHDRETLDALFWLNFGLRCVDAIRPVTDIISGYTAMKIQKITAEDAELLLSLHREHWQYYKSAPMFMHVHDDCSLEELRGWLDQKDQHLWAANENGIPVAYMQLRHGGETFISDDEKSMNICGAYVSPFIRGAGYGTAILQTIVDWLRENGYERLGVDYESFNIQGSRFWGKYFTPFTYSLTRRIDERICQSM